VRKPVESSKNVGDNAKGEKGCISIVKMPRPTAWPSTPTVRNGKYSENQPACAALRKVHQRLIWKFHRLATRNAMVEKT